MAAAKKHNVIKSWDNRRLWCLKEYQKVVKHEVHVRFLFYDLDKFEKRCDGDGQNVTIRKGR